MKDDLLMKKNNYGALTYLFWWCSGAVIPILEKYPTEKNKYVGIGAAIFGTWLLATCSGTYAFYIIFKSLWVAIPVGIIYGLIIFNLDRFITSSMKKVGSEDEVYLTHERFGNFLYYELAPAFPRLVIALIIGLAISKPLELKLFEVEIEKQLEADYEANVNDFAKLLAANSQRLKTELTDRLTDLEVKLQSKQRYIDQKTDTLNMEVQGKRASGLIGYGDRARRLAALVDEAIFEKSEIKEEIQITKAALGRLQTEQGKKIEAYKLEQKEQVGFFDKIEALSNLIRSPENVPIWWANLLIIMLIILIEIAPILVKLISVRGPYDAELEYINKKWMIERDREIRQIKYAREPK